jgi:hypothetical protein
MQCARLRVADDQERLVLATGRYIGEGFDDSRLDALFLTMPISWKGTLAQYVGRLHRQHAGPLAEYLPPRRDAIGDWCRRHVANVPAPDATKWSARLHRPQQSERGRGGWRRAAAKPASRCKSRRMRHQPTDPPLRSRLQHSVGVSEAAVAGRHTPPYSWQA